MDEKIDKLDMEELVREILEVNMEKRVGSDRNFPVMRL